MGNAYFAGAYAVAMIQLRISGVPLDTGDWVGIGLLIVFTPGAVWGLWVCRVSYREILPEKLIRVTNRGRKLTLHYWQIDSSYFTLLGDENGSSNSPTPQG